MLLKLSWYFWKFFPPMQHWLPPHMKSHHHVKRLKDMSIALSKLHFYLKCFLTVLSLNMYNSFLVSGRLPSPLAFVLTLCLQLSHTWLYTFFSVTFPLCYSLNVFVLSPDSCIETKGPKSWLGGFWEIIILWGWNPHELD